MKNILFTPPATISKEDKKSLSGEGYLVIEVDDVSKIKTISDLSLIGISDISVSAIESVKESTSDSLRAMFANKLLTKTISKIKK